MQEKKFFKRNNGSEAIIVVVGTHESGDNLCLWLSDAKFCTNNYGNPFRYHKYDFDKEFVEISEEEINKLEWHHCPQRLNKPVVEDSDYWKVLPNGDKVCSYCGSLHPNTLIELIKEHGLKIVERSTKSYKWYINNPGVLNCEAMGHKYYRYHDTEEFVKFLNEINFGNNKK